MKINKKNKTIEIDKAQQTIEPWVPIAMIIAMLVQNEDEFLPKWNDFLKRVLQDEKVEEHEVLEIITKLQDDCSIFVPVDSTFFRARLFNDSEAEKLSKREIWDDLKKNLNIGFFCKNPESINNSFWNNLLDVSPNIEKTLKDWVNKYNNIKFWGFKNREECGANKSNNSSEGRLNRTGQHHLYLAEDIETAIYEMRAINQQLVNISAVKTIKELKIFDFCKNFDPGLGTNEAKNVLMLYPIARASSKPNFGEDTYYKPTQVISDYIKSLGFAGIQYPSSLKKDGKNILIFEDFNIEPEDNQKNPTLKILDSSIYKVLETKIEYEKCFPIELQR